MSLVRIGDITIGTIRPIPAVNEEGIAYQASRVDGDSMVVVGTARNKRAAVNLIGRSLIAKSLDNGGLSPTQRANLADLQGQLEAMGLGELAKAVNAALRP